jgi:4-amino-4-deoxy-L-arabinose transferase-like glycosyltransferase
VLTNSPQQQRFLLSAAAIILFSALIQFAALRTNPPGFFLDESSIAYNAHTISQSGRDEHGVAWPLFFRAFGEFKNPVYIYLLAGVFRVTGPGILAGRVLSATLGLLTILLLGLLAFQLTQARGTALLFSLLVLFTPWTFELSRLVLEVAIYPFAIALFLLAVWNAARKPAWSITQICALAGTLALLTYSYSIGRLFAPLLALSLIVFVNRRRLPGLLLTWFAYAVALIPLLIFQQRNPAALTSRFHYLSYLKPESSATQVVREFVQHLFANLNPWRLFVTESAKTNELLHVPGSPAMLTITVVLIVVSLVLLFKQRRIDAWWRFVFCGLFASLAPASLTTDDFHMLRLAPLVVFLLVLTIPALQWLTETDVRWKRGVLIAIMVFVCAQGLFFQWRYHASVTSPRRLHTFDADYPAMILPSALNAAGSQPVYLADNPARPAYVQALWYANLWHIPLTKFISLGFDQSPPEGAVVITTEEHCPRCRVLASSEPYTTYVATGPARVLTRLPDDGMRAELNVTDPPAQLRAGQPITIQVAVKNVSHSLWLAAERSGGDFRLSLGNHWLDHDGNVVVNDDGRNAITGDVSPGAVITMPLIINAPRRTGEYLLEVDMVQEGASWFGLKGSRTWRGKVIVID